MKLLLLGAYINDFEMLLLLFVLLLSVSTYTSVKDMLVGIFKCVLGFDFEDLCGVVVNVNGEGVG